MSQSSIYIIVTDALASIEGRKSDTVTTVSVIFRAQRYMEVDPSCCGAEYL